MKFFVGLVTTLVALLVYMTYLLLTAQALPVWLIVALITLATIIMVSIVVAIVFFIMLVQFMAQIGAGIFETLYDRF